MREIFIVLVALVFGSSQVAGWEEDPRCRRRRELSKALAANSSDTNGSGLDLVNREHYRTRDTYALDGEKVDDEKSISSGITDADDSHRHLTGDFDFSVKMYWEEGFCWQEEWIERKWCWQCEGGNCNEGDKILLRVCSGSSRQRFVYLPASGGRGRFSPKTRRDLCFEMRSDKRMRLAKCDSGDSDQLFKGFKSNGDEFELFPSGQDERLLSQLHDPKSYEEVFAEVKSTARGDHTSEWVVYKPNGGSSGPAPSPTSQPASSCIISLNLRDGNFIQDGQRLRSPDDKDLYLEQRKSGNLRVTDGERTLWSSSFSGSSDDYWTTLQGDGNLITWEGKPKNRDDRVWSSRSSSGSSDYFLGLDCRKQYIGIYRGSPNNPGGRVWKERTRSSSAPSPTPTSSRPKIKYIRSDYCTPSNKCGLCEGDCDSNADCEGNLVCYQRDPHGSFPGCSGGSSDRSAADYCVKPYR